MVRFILIIIFLGFSFPSNAQNVYDQLSTTSKKAAEYYIRGDNYYVRRDYASAITWFDKAVKKDRNFTEAYFRLGSTYYRMFDTLNAKYHWEKAIQVTENDPEHAYLYYYLGRLYYESGDYDKSVDATTVYFSLNPKDTKFNERVKWLKDNAEFSIESIAEDLQFNPRPLLAELNKFPLQYFPVMPVDEQRIIFTGRTGYEPYHDEDIYISSRTVDGQWDTPVSISENINSENNEGTCTISADGRMLIFTSCLGRDGYGSCDLFVSYKNGEEWSEPENLGAGVNSGAWESQPSLSADGRTLYFVSDRNGGEGRRDIWVSVLGSDGKWEKAENAGPVVNTFEDEVSPFIHVNGQRLYFASKGHVGLGRFDIFYSDYSGEDWGEPVNMGYPLNTFEDQVALYITPDGSKGIYSLDKGKALRKRSLLYEINIPEKIRLKYKSSYVRGKVVDSKTKLPLAAVVELRDLSSQRPLLKVKSDSVSGDYVMVLTEGADYGLFVSKEGYLFRSPQFNFSNTNTGSSVVVDVELDPIELGASTVLNNIFFEVNSAELNSKSNIEILEVVRFLENNPNVSIVIEGHTDNTGTDEYNLDLSNRRATAVMNVLISKGFDNHRISARGFGFQVSLADNSTEAGRSRNRRIEFRIIR